MIKPVVTLILMLCMAAAIIAQPAFGWGPGPSGLPSFKGFPPPEFFLQVVLEKECQKLLSQPNFPEDLKPRIQDAMTAAKTDLDNCSAATVGALPWMQIRCTMQQVQKSKATLKAIEDEANARAAAAVEKRTAL